jgi:PAS domain S-box-containing protein
VRANAHTREVPVILVSARAGEEARIEGLEASTDDYLVKPFSANELLATVAGHINMLEVRRQSREALRASEERYRHLLSFLPVAVYTCTSPAGEITFYNERAAELWGRKPEPGDIDERFCGSYRLWRPDGTRLPHHQTPMALAVRQGLAFRNEEVVIERPDGTRINVLVNIDPLYDDNGNLVGAINAFHDTTELKLTQQALLTSDERYRQIFEQSIDGVFIASRNGQYVDVSPSGCAMLGMTREEVLSISFNDVLVPEEIERLPAEISEFVDGKVHRSEWRFRRKDGSEFVGEVSGRELPDGRLQGIVRDITERKKAEVALRKSERELADFFDNAAIGLHWVGKNGIILRANKAELEMLGYTRDEYLGKHIADFHADQSVVENILARLTGGEALHDYPARLRCKNGSIRDVLITSSALFEDGEFIHTRCFTTDVTARKQAEERLAAELEATKRLHSLSLRLGSADHLPSALEDLLDNAIASCNADFGHIQLYDPQTGGLEIVAQRGFQQELLDSLYRPRIYDGSAVSRAFQNGERIVIADVSTDSAFAPLRGIAAATGFRAVQSTPLKTHDGQIVGILSTYFRNPHRLSERDERSLDLYARHAADLIERFQFEHALKEADRRKDEFLATLAHELRNPLAPICNGLQLIRLSENDREALNEATTIIERQVHQMVRLVDDLLDVARINSNKLELRKEPVTLDKIVNIALETSRPLIESATHQLQVSLPEEPVILDADPVRLAQAFSNLLNNAAKYSQRGSRIRLKALLENGHLVVRVRDTGIGIDTDKLPQIFEMFVQVDPAKERAQGGLGIGLTLVKRLVEMHGGSIEARSEGIGKGSEFIIQLPVSTAKPAAQRAPEEIKQPKQQLAKCRILVVDDNVDSAESMALMLQLSGHEVAMAHDGLGAIEMAERFQPDVAFLDLGMPKLNGYDAALSIRRQPWGQNIVLVALTGWGQEEDKRRTREAGFNAHVVKPIDFLHLEQLVAEVSNGKRVQ